MWVLTSLCLVGEESCLWCRARKTLAGPFQKLAQNLAPRASDAGHSQTRAGRQRPRQGLAQNTALAHHPATLHSGLLSPTSQRLSLSERRTECKFPLPPRSARSLTVRPVCLTPLHRARGLPSAAWYDDLLLQKLKTLM